MSLINDALKKAQKQRTGEAPTLSAMPGIGGESAARIAKRSKPAGFNSLLLRAGIGAAVLLVLAGGGYFAFRASPAGAAVTPPTTTAVTATPAAPLPAPSATTPPPASSFTLPVAPKTEPIAAKVEPAKPLPVAVAPATPAQPATPEPKPVAAAPAPKPVLKLEPRAIQFIEGIKVAGIRASATDSKVLMNDRVYRVGDVVEHELGLKLTGITSSSLTFEDERGGSYTRSF